VVGPDTAKSRRPIVVLVCGTTSVPLSADRNCHLPPDVTSAVKPGDFNDHPDVVVCVPTVIASCNLQPITAYRPIDGISPLSGIIGHTRPPRSP